MEIGFGQMVQTKGAYTFFIFIKALAAGHANLRIYQSKKVIQKC